MKSPRNFLDLPADLTAAEFESLVHDWFERSFGSLQKFSATLCEHMMGRSGEYEIDVSVRFQALGADFLVLVECKHQKRPVEREVVQILHDRIQEIGAHKGMILTTSSFQSGAVEYARSHGICLVKVADGKTCYMTRALDAPREPPPWAKIPPFVGWICSPGDSYRLLSSDHVEYLKEVFHPD